MFEVKFNILGCVFCHMAFLGMDINWQRGAEYKYGRKHSDASNKASIMWTDFLAKLQS